MTELQADDATATYVRRQAEAAGLTEAEWLTRHFREVALRESASTLTSWYDERPGLLDEELRASEAASAEADAA